MNPIQNYDELDRLIYSSISIDALKARYKELTAYRDKVNASIVEDQKALEKANAKAEVARLEAVAIAEKIQKARGNERWLKLKREIGALASAIQGK